ncbi:hypothetical protein BJ980_000026 [Nocardioides daedukensis]|uniref:Uncharacterized protein n=1 Tax=Nocardioides daedukensis TaxID=634462 RepID=A0A7Y9UM30_9ACTN|nr:hypothetical protein [Nocardioides daedukensis]NYG57103.1 hypothetical protein [Nocardioides daedukensis]
MTSADPIQWTLVRGALLVVGEPPESFNLSLTLGDVTVDVLGPVQKNDKLLGMLAVAHVDLEAGPVAGKTVILPHELREKAEFALEIVTRLVGLDRGVVHRTVSTIPCLGFVPSDLSMLEALDGTDVDHSRPPAPMVGHGAKGILDEEKDVALLQDRLDGVVLLSEAFNTSGPVGQFTQFWRFFERAFKLGHTELTPKLKEFLAGSKHGFADAEVQEWVDARNPAVHANRGTTFTLDSDVLQHVRRMTEAAYDVLMNKVNWWSKDAERRDAWSAASGSSGPNSDMFLTKGKGAGFQLLLTDEFGSFVCSMDGSFERYLPEGLWLHSEADGGTLKWNAVPLDALTDEPQ